MSQQHERCKAEEWHRDGRGLWAMRACAAAEQHGGPHVFLGWTYNVQPPAAEASAVSPADQSKMTGQIVRDRVQEQLRAIVRTVRGQGTLNHTLVHDAAEAAGSLIQNLGDLVLTLERASAVSPEGAQESAERTLRSIAAMLGWVNLPPRETLEAEIRALKARATSLSPSPTTSEPTTKTD